MLDYPLAIHHPLKRWRFERGLTLNDFAAAVKLSRAMLSEVECWNKTLSVESGRRVAEATGLSLDDVLKKSPKSE